ncbi:dihydrolipoyl dehydrogenase [Lactarius pseudohatsudake]|nr:dihydrolipoyl dehydrogenase [Lactarius pseudohatsudake]
MVTGSPDAGPGFAAPMLPHGTLGPLGQPRDVLRRDTIVVCTVILDYSKGEVDNDRWFVGPGASGYVAAIKAAQLGLKAACIEKRGTLGGTCLSVGCIPSKAMLNNPHIYHQTLHDIKKHGIDAKEDSVGGPAKGIEILFKKNIVDYIKEAASFVSPNTISMQPNDGGESTVEAKTIIIATGSEVAPFPFPGGAIEIDGQQIMVPEKAVVIGGGIIGLEMGVWSRPGAEVTVVEFLNGISGVGIDEEISCVVTTEAAKDGKQDSADVVLVAVGHTFKASASKFIVDSRGRIVIVQHERAEHQAEEEGIAAVEYFYSGHGHVDYGTIPSVVYTHPEELKLGDVKYMVGRFPFLANSRATTNLDTEDRVKFLVEAETARILGMHIIGPDAGEVIAEGVLALEYGASDAENISRMTHAHPTPSEAFHETALQVSSGSAVHF